MCNHMERQPESCENKARIRLIVPMNNKLTKRRKCHVTAEGVPEGFARDGTSAGGAESVEGRDASSGNGASMACMSSAFGAFLAGHVACIYQKKVRCMLHSSVCVSACPRYTSRGAT